MPTQSSITSFFTPASPDQVAQNDQLEWGRQQSWNQATGALWRLCAEEKIELADEIQQSNAADWAHAYWAQCKAAGMNAKKQVNCYFLLFQMLTILYNKFQLQPPPPCLLSLFNLLIPWICHSRRPQRGRLHWVQHPLALEPPRNIGLAQILGLTLQKLPFAMTGQLEQLSHIFSRHLLVLPASIPWPIQLSGRWWTTTMPGHGVHKHWLVLSQRRIRERYQKLWVTLKYL